MCSQDCPKADVEKDKKKCQIFKKIVLLPLNNKNDRDHGDDNDDDHDIIMIILIIIEAS